MHKKWRILGLLAIVLGACCAFFFYRYDVWLEKEWNEALLESWEVLNEMLDNKDTPYENSIDEEILDEEEVIEETAINDTNTYPQYGIVEENIWEEESFFENNQLEEEEMLETEKLLLEALTSMNPKMTNKNFVIMINWEQYEALLEDNTTAQAFYKQFIEKNWEVYTMQELNWNEKYLYISEKIASNPVGGLNIEAWDIMLYWDDCIVIFYKSFQTSYSYTKIWHINWLWDLWEENIEVNFSIH